MITEILNRLSGHTRLARPPKAAPLAEPLTDAELRVLRYLPTHLQTPDIAAELVVSVTTIRTHIRHVYTKLGAHDRGEAVQRAGALGLLAPPTGPRSTV